MELVEFARYSTVAQRSLYDFVVANPDTFVAKIETTSPFKSIQDLLVHCIGAEERWVARAVHQPRPPRYEDYPLKSLPELYQDWDSHREKTLSIIQNTSSVDLAHSDPVELPGWEHKTQMTIEEMLFTVFNHESYHRAQCSMILQTRGFDPPNFDYVFYVHRIKEA